MDDNNCVLDFFNHRLTSSMNATTIANYSLVPRLPPFYALRFAFSIIATR